MYIELNEQLQKVLVEHIAVSANGIAVLDVNDKFIFFNAAFSSIFNLDEHQILEHSFEDLMIWMHDRGTGVNSQGLSIDEWLAFVRSQYRSAIFRNYEVGLVDGRWLLMTEQINTTGEVVLVCNDITEAKQIESALRSAKKELETLASTDFLTGLSNRRIFMQYLINEYNRGIRYKSHATLVFIDLDFFKKVNDKFGHSAGDLVLCHFSSFLRKNLRKQDIIGRLGGEEFALLLPETKMADAAPLADRIQKLLSYEMVDEVEPGFQYTFSAGVVELDVDGNVSYQEWLNNADRALYQAKANGRNQICYRSHI